MAARQVLSMMPPVQNRKPRMFWAIELGANLLEIEVSEVDGISNEINHLHGSKQCITFARAHNTITFALIFSR